MSKFIAENKNLIVEGCFKNLDKLCGIAKNFSVCWIICRADSQILSAYKILDVYERRTEKFLLINTSFNAKNEPIVETPQEALTCAKNFGVKYILCNGLLIK